MSAYRIPLIGRVREFDPHGASSDVGPQPLARRARVLERERAAFIRPRTAHSQGRPAGEPKEFRFRCKRKCLRRARLDVRTRDRAAAQVLTKRRSVVHHAALREAVAEEVLLGIERPWVVVTRPATSGDTLNVTSTKSLKSASRAVLQTWQNVCAAALVSDVSRSTISPQPGQTYCHSIVSSPSFRAWRNISTTAPVANPCCCAKWTGLIRTSASSLAVRTKTSNAWSNLPALPATAASSASFSANSRWFTGKAEAPSPIMPAILFLPREARV